MGNGPLARHKKKNCDSLDQFRQLKKGDDSHLAFLQNVNMRKNILYPIQARSIINPTGSKETLLGTCGQNFDTFRSNTLFDTCERSFNPICQMSLFEKAN